MQKPWRVSRTWSNIACLALAPLSLAVAQAGHAQGVAADAAHKLPEVTESGPMADGWQIIVKVAKQDYAPGEPVKLLVTLKNVSGKDQLLWGYSDWSFAVSCDGVEMPATEYGIKSRQAWVDRRRLLYGSNTNLIYSSGGMKVYPFGPGKAKVYNLAVSRYSDMTLDGTYKVIVKRDTSDNAQLVADPICVQVGKAGTQ